MTHVKQLKSRNYFLNFVHSISKSQKVKFKCINYNKTFILLLLNLCLEDTN